MHKSHFGIGPGRLRRAGFRLFHAAVLALLLAVMAMPARAADDRPIKVRVAPTYPEIARRMRISGVVRVEATVNPDGTVSNAKAVSGNRALCASAEEAVGKWRFAPAEAQSAVTVEVTFTLAQ